MDINEIVDLAEKLIAIPSITGNEKTVCDYLFHFFKSKEWTVEKIPVDADRYNLLIPFGTPRIIFTTHLDVVPAPSLAFQPRRVANKLYGRGACDAKGIVVSMIAAAEQLMHKGAKDFALLFVVGEEIGSGLGAKAASKYLQKKGVRYLVNGEPTEGKLIEAHKGVLNVKICCKGKACHSGYPELGEDANVKLIQVGHNLLHTDFGEDPILGSATINLGLIEAGVGANVVSPQAEMTCVVRTVDNTDSALQKMNKATSGLASVEVLARLSTGKMMIVDGFATGTVSFGTDIPNFSTLGADCLLYGPGSILVAHTDDEYIEINEIEKAVTDYQLLFDQLKKLL